MANSQKIRKVIIGKSHYVSKSLFFILHTISNFFDPIMTKVLRARDQTRSHKQWKTRHLIWQLLFGTISDTNREINYKNQIKDRILTSGLKMSVNYDPVRGSMYQEINKWAKNEPSIISHLSLIAINVGCIISKGQWKKTSKKTKTGLFFTTF